MYVGDHFQRKSRTTVCTRVWVQWLKSWEKKSFVQADIFSTTWDLLKKFNRNHTYCDFEEKKEELYGIYQKFVRIARKKIRISKQYTKYVSTYIENKWASKT